MHILHGKISLLLSGLALLLPKIYMTVRDKQALQHNIALQA